MSVKKLKNKLHYRENSVQIFSFVPNL